MADCRQNYMELHTIVALRLWYRLYLAFFILKKARIENIVIVRCLRRSNEGKNSSFIFILFMFSNTRLQHRRSDRLWYVETAEPYQQYIGADAGEVERFGHFEST
jgi:hypothetical protein